MKKLKLKSLKEVLVEVIILSVFSAMCLIYALPGFIVRNFTKPADFADLDFYDDLDGLYVKGDVYFIYDYYCERIYDGSVSQKEYIIDAGTKRYMGLVFSKKDIAKADALMEESWGYLDGENDGSRLYEMRIPIEGTIRPISSETVGYYYDYLDYDNLTEEEQELFLPYYIKTGEVRGSYLSTMYCVLAVGVILLVFVLVRLIRIFTGGYQKAVKKYIADSASPEAEKERVKNFLENTPDTGGILVNREFVCAQKKMVTIFKKTKDLVWAYGTTSQLWLHFMDGSKETILLTKKDQNATAALKQIKTQCPHVLTGYSQEWEQLFYQDREAFLQLKYNENQMI